MGRRALTAEEKAEKAGRERVRLRQYRSAPRLSNRVLHIDAHRLDSINTHPSTLPGDPIPETQSDETAFIGHHHDLEHRDNVTLQPTDDQPASATPLANQPIVTTLDPIVIVDNGTILRPIDEQTYPLTIEDQEETEPISAVDVAGPTFLIQYDEEQAARAGRPRIDPAVSPHERTRLRVQRHRDRQHLTRAQQLVQWSTDSHGLPPTLEFSALTLRNGPAPSLVPDEAAEKGEGDARSESSGFDNDIAGPDFLRAQSDVYDRILRKFFNNQCDCQEPRARGEPEHTSTLPEYIQYIGRSLPPLPTVFAGRDEACDPRASFPQWQSFLSDQTAQPLSFRKTQASLSQDAVTIARLWDVDSIWFGAGSLSAIRAPNQFRLSFFSPHKSNISTAQVIQPHGLDLAHTRHTTIGTFTAADVRFSVLMFFPSGASSQTRASSNSLSLARFRDLYDEIILPAVRETVPDHVRQEIPRSYDLIYAKSRAYQEKPGVGRWGAEDESRAFRLAYGIPASVLPQFWAAVVRNANLHRVQSKKGDAIPYFQNPRLLFQAHDLKNIFASQSLQESLALFRDTVLAGLDPTQIDMHSCWLDVGMRDHVRTPPASPTHEPWTLLWKDDCCRHLHGQVAGIVPEAPMEATYYRSHLLRDVGGYYAKAKSSRKSNPGHPEARSPGVIRAKAYNCSKELFGVMFSDYQLFGSGFLPLLAFDEGMLKDLAATDQSRQRAFVSQLSRSRLLDAWDANKRHMRAVSSSRIHANFGVRKEVTFRLDVILAMWASGRLEPGQSPHTGPMCWEVPLAPSSISPPPPIDGEQQHCPFWVIPTEMLTAFVSMQAARFVLPLDYIFSEITRLFCCLLIHAVSSEREYRFDYWIWRSAWQVKDRSRRNGRRKERQGLGLGNSIDSSGTLWMPHGHFDWQRGHISLELLVDLYISRSPLQAKLAHQTNVQALTANQVTIELLFQRLVRAARAEHDQGRNEDAESLADRAITLAVEETARAYHQHFLAKLHSYWDRLRGKIGRQKLATVHGIYAEAWAKYCQVTADDDDDGDINASSSSPPLRSTLPEELPCWMNTRRRMPPKNSWSDFLSDQIFCPPKPPTWNALLFLQLYRGFKEVWQGICAPLGPFDSRFSRQIGKSCGSSNEWDVFYVPVAEIYISKEIFEDTASQPTILLPTSDNIIGLLDAIETLTGPSSNIAERLSWTRRRLNNQGERYDLPSYLAARHREVEPSTRNRSLLERFLYQCEPPERDIEPVDEEDEEEAEERAEEDDSSSGGDDDDDDDDLEEAGSIDS
ncbi:uncharacterized protein NECHADRAFT_88406 [Fusarium vanettenii 77-13-4]|uniref:Uncharacterized protein n=1 Tax=Fusarium vanettenii (strain ATCC MYA-4622 / CBS 123669 / FGSC 9596 / NRRL 45880 / 77-13-4) TaxID=660122 RepID=C7ZMC0_FUSV7|nr:uncharacterized protein NECHADRAFT_88406 [Fusarium vanettenii 77-13-4]EEU34826.1 predicted protein [Fusarium vanettenii 77-13-4]